MAFFFFFTKFAFKDVHMDLVVLDYRSFILMPLFEFV